MYVKTPALYSQCISVFVSGAFVLTCPHVYADRFSSQLEYSAVHDSNFSRSSVAQDETINIAALKINAADKFSKQDLKLALAFNKLTYDNNEELDSSYTTGEADWQGQVGKKILFDLVAKREAFAVDPLEYTGKDIITKNDYLAKVGFGSREKISVWAGGSKIDQEHSAFERELLDFDQEAVFVEIQLSSAGGLHHQLTAAEGERRYKTGVNTTGDFIDFDYNQYSYEIDWDMNETNQFSLRVAQFERRGQVNDDTGFVWSGYWQWQATSKVSMRVGFESNKPAAGEEIESPEKIDNATLALRWQVSERWNVATDFLHSEQEYISRTLLSAREEQWQRWRPLIISYSTGGLFSARLDTELYERQSDSGVREYDGDRVNLTLALRF